MNALYKAMVEKNQKTKTHFEKLSLFQRQGERKLPVFSNSWLLILCVSAQLSQTNPPWSSNKNILSLFWYGFAFIRFFWWFLHSTITIYIFSVIYVQPQIHSLCLAHSKNSINVDQVNEWMNNSFSLISSWLRYRCSQEALLESSRPS